MESSCSIESDVLSVSSLESPRASTPLMDEDSLELNSSYEHLDTSSNSCDSTDEAIANDEDKNQPLFPGSTLSIFDSYLLFLQYALRHSLTKKAFEELITLVGYHLPAVKLDSAYKLKKYFLNLFSDIKYTTCYCCSYCHQLLKSENDLCPNRCECGTQDFLFIPVEAQLKRKMEGVL